MHESDYINYNFVIFHLAVLRIVVDRAVFYCKGLYVFKMLVQSTWFRLKETQMKRLVISTREGIRGNAVSRGHGLHTNAHSVPHMSGRASLYLHATFTSLFVTIT